MTFEHTAGPWEVHKYPTTIGGNGFVIRNKANAGITVASASPGFTTDRIEQVAEANARLMAAAPEMLAALKAAEIAVTELCYDQDPANQCWVTLAEIRAAIKATGA